jgi:hypothetical protein
MMQQKKHLSKWRFGGQNNIRAHRETHDSGCICAVLQLNRRYPVSEEGSA